MLPAVIHEQLIHPFNFYFNGAVCKGMSHQGNLYRLLQSFESYQRAKAFAIACEISNLGVQTVVTASKEHYEIWVDLRYVAQMQSSESPISADAASDYAKEISTNRSSKLSGEKLSFLSDAVRLLNTSSYHLAV